ncbi:MAG: hypothetical protein HQM10_00135 [Candidatus Riflebacteria bacterium]|nr:hypothetical protein [Candidatus Riflebacteria bacterium]
MKISHRLAFVAALCLLVFAASSFASPFDGSDVKLDKQAGGIFQKAADLLNLNTEEKLLEKSKKITSVSELRKFASEIKDNSLRVQVFIEAAKRLTLNSQEVIEILSDPCFQNFDSKMAFFREAIQKISVRDAISNKIWSQFGSQGTPDQALKELAKRSDNVEEIIELARECNSQDNASVIIQTALTLPLKIQDYIRLAELADENTALFIVEAGLKKTSSVKESCQLLQAGDLDGAEIQKHLYKLSPLARSHEDYRCLADAAKNQETKNVFLEKARLLSPVIGSQTEMIDSLKADIFQKYSILLIENGTKTTVDSIHATAKVLDLFLKNFVWQLVKFNLKDILKTIKGQETILAGLIGGHFLFIFPEMDFRKIPIRQLLFTKWLIASKINIRNLKMNGRMFSGKTDCPFRHL